MIKLFKSKQWLEWPWSLIVGGVVGVCFTFGLFYFLAHYTADLLITKPAPVAPVVNTKPVPQTPPPAPEKKITLIETPKLDLPLPQIQPTPVDLPKPLSAEELKALAPEERLVYEKLMEHLKVLQGRAEDLQVEKAILEQRLKMMEAHSHDLSDSLDALGLPKGSPALTQGEPETSVSASPKP